MNNLIKFVMIALAVLLISSAAYAKKDNGGENAGKKNNTAVYRCNTCSSPEIPGEYRFVKII